MMNVILIILFLCTTSSGQVLLYNTENGQAINKFDCIYHVYNDGEEIPYCRRTEQDVVLNRTTIVCQNDGEIFFFRHLIMQKVHPSDVLKWSSSLEIADKYARFFYNETFIDNIDDHYVCNCTKHGTFGKFCEYQLTHNAKSFQDSIHIQFQEKQTGDSWNTQRYGRILCYTTLMCDSGLLCLDWRDIDDGIQRCSGGYDEANADLLEFNECKENEYRCTNGMCIPEEFWLDGHVDCMDWSDELRDDFSKSCSFSSNAMECDEHICPRQSFSCGDGQCIDWITRMSFPAIILPENNCFNKRNLNHMCEINPHQPTWTLSNGLCIPDKDYDDFLFPSWNRINSSDLNNDEICTYLLRCALSDGLERDCPCNRSRCVYFMANICSNNSVFIYPKSPLINPNVLFYFKYDFYKNLIIDGILLIGTKQCHKHLVTIKEYTIVPYSLATIQYSIINHIFCTLPDQYVNKRNSSSDSVYQHPCYDNSSALNEHLSAITAYMCKTTGQCISQYRINDGIVDCLTADDENKNVEQNLCTGNVGQHRFQCFSQEYKCLPLSELGSGLAQCLNGYDERIYGRGLSIRERFQCQPENTEDCNHLKTYIRQSSNMNPIKPELSFNRTTEKISFRSYCDTHWDLDNHIDESPTMCQHWVCEPDQYQCRTGQCIKLEWVCDGEWDCSDATDEEALLSITHWSVHNTHLGNLKPLIDKCLQLYRNAPFSRLCDISSEFACYRSDVLNPLDLAMNRPCIKLTQIGDGVEDCYNAYDEKNTFQSMSDKNQMWGFHLRCGNHSQSYSHACLPEEKSDCTKILCSNHRHDNESCSGINDAICLDGTCIKNGRCNGLMDCEFGEDEYWCPVNVFTNHVDEYREYKRETHKPINLNLLPQFPSKIHRKQIFKSNKLNIRNRNSSPMLSYICNRGIAVLEMDKIVCLCPPAYYGQFCEYYSDRISIIAQLDQQTVVKSTLKIRAKFLYYSQIIDEHEFTIIPTIEKEKSIKHKFYLLYSRSNQMLAEKRRRYFNRTWLINEQPYTVLFDVFSLENDHGIKELGSWHYPIYLDHLPAYRLAVMLKFPTWIANKTDHPCANNTCNQNSTCMPVLNQKNTYYCSCKNGFYGANCEFHDQRCSTYCSNNALCHYHNIRENPTCLCSKSYYGPQCNLKRDECDTYPCFNNGTCLLTNDSSGEIPYICLCSNHFYGNQCQYKPRSVYIDLLMKDPINIHASIIQLYDIDTSDYQLLLRHQQVHHGLPSKIMYSHSKLHAPALGLLKTYENLTHPQYFIMYVLAQTTMINITSFPQHCPHISVLLSPDIVNNVDSTPFLYHQLCHSNTSLLCFSTDNYICVCQSDHYRVECFNYDTHLDQCNYCLSDGKCLQGDRNDPNDFICICPSSHYGSHCQFSINQPNSTTIVMNTSTTTFESPFNNTSKTAQLNYTLIVLFIYGVALLIFKNF
ncbi:hypothetical protein I4U23_011807 [Adineta vaga]|nr:hypothetical protein I4U23_011807 [Adineta vaga]